MVAGEPVGVRSVCPISFDVVFCIQVFLLCLCLDTKPVFQGTVVPTRSREGLGYVSTALSSRFSTIKETKVDCREIECGAALCMAQ